MIRFDPIKSIFERSASSSRGKRTLCFKIYALVKSGKNEKTLCKLIVQFLD